MHRSENLARLRAYAAAHPTDVQVVAELATAMAELDAYAVLAKLAAAWASGRTRAQRLHLLSTYGVDVSECRAAAIRRTIARERMRATFDEALERSLTPTRRGIGNPGLAAKLESRREEPFLLERVKRLPPPSPVGEASSPSSGVRARERPATDVVGRVARYFRADRRTGSRHGSD